MYKFREFYIRDQMMEGIENYIKHRQVPGSFLSAIISNDLIGAVGRADDENMKNIPAFVEYFYNNAPPVCWGSEKNMNQWLKGTVK